MPAHSEGGLQNAPFLVFIFCNPFFISAMRFVAYSLLSVVLSMLIHRKLNTYAEVIEEVTPTHMHREK